MENDFYENRIDKIFGKGLWKHRTLRTIFDPGSYEWSETEIPVKLEYLQKILKSGEQLERLIMDYKQRYREQNNLRVVHSLEDGLAILLENAMINSPEKLKENKQCDNTSY